MTPWVARFFTASTSRQGSVQRLIDGTGSKLPPEDLEWYRALINDEGHVNGTLGMMAQWTLDPLLRALPQHAVQTLLITSDRDKTVPPKTSQDVAANMPNATTLSLPGLGHLAHEEDAKVVCAVITNFLRDQIS